MSGLFSLKKEIIKQSQQFYNATSKEDKQKIRESLQKSFKKVHKFRHSPMIDYKSIEKMIKNII